MIEITIDPKTVIERCLITAFSLDEYLDLINEVHQPGFVAIPTFQKKYNRFYRVRQKSARWYKAYYQLLEEQIRFPRSFEELLRTMYPISNTIEVSFISKMIATVSPEMPIWDQYILQNLGLKNDWERKRSATVDERIRYAANIYSEIQAWYDSFVCSEKGIECIKKFDEALPSFKNDLTATKKIDYILWSFR